MKAGSLIFTVAASGWAYKIFGLDGAMLVFCSLMAVCIACNRREDE